MRRAFIAAGLLLAACHHDHPTEPPHVVPDAAVAIAAPDAAPARVPETPKPALRLPTDFTPSAYVAHLAIDPAKPTFHGTIDITANLSEPVSVVWLNAVGLTIATAEARTGDVSITLTPEVVDGGFLALHAARDLPAGEVTVHMEYDGGLRTDDSTGAFVQKVGDDPYVITQFEPIDARAVFPCFDEPSNKVPWTLTLDVPSADTALSNTPVDHEDDLGGGQKSVHFQTTTPLPSYLVAFAIGPFEMVDGGKTRSGAPIRIAAFRGRSADAAYAAKVTKDVLGTLEDYFGTPYPFAKLDMVPIPSATWFGAMENAGMITFQQTLLLHPKDASPGDLLFYDDVAGHEMAHQWFGDLVTLSWWDDIWLNEAFATWMEDKVMRTRPGWADGAEGSHRDAGLGSDELVSARRVRQPIESEGDIRTAFDGITYQKGAAVISMFEQWVGPEAFRAGVQAYLAAHKNGVTDVHDFLTSVDDATPKDLAPAFSTFLDQGGAPMVNATLSCTGAPSVTLTQSRWLPRDSAAPAGDAPLWQIPICIAAGDDKKRAPDTCTTLTTATATVPLDGVKACPTWFLPDAHAAGYFHVQLATKDYEALSKHGWKQLTPIEHLLVMNEGSAMIHHGDPVPVGDLYDLVPKLRAGNRLEILQGAGAAGSTDQVVSDALRPAMRRWLVKNFGPIARKLGWLPGKHDTLDTQLERGTMMWLDAGIGRDPALLASAVKLAAKWRDLPESFRGQILGAAVIADPKLAQKLLGELATENDRLLHADLLGALSATEDPAIAKALLERLLDPATDLVQDNFVPLMLAHRPIYDVVETFLEAHFDELAPRLPELARAGMIGGLTASCDAGKRDAVAAWATQHLTPQPGGERTVAQGLESMDVCIRQKAALQPEVDAWVKRHAK